MKLLSMAVMTAFMFLTFTIAYAQDADAQASKDHYPIGQLVALEGKAFYNSDKQPIEMKLNDPVYLNTIVETGPGSKALIMFIDNTQITLGENSEMLIDEFVFDPYDPEENKGSFEMTKGPFLWVSGLIGKKKEPDVNIKTKVGSIGIRGTQFWGGDTGTNQYGVYVFDGKVNFATQKGNVDLPKDTGVVVGGEQSDFDQTSWPEKRLTDAVATVTFAKASEVANRIAAQKIDNTAKQHDYRGRMFPYKENPMEPRMKGKDDKFFTDEFENMQNKQ